MSKIYRFTQTIDLLDGAKLKQGDAIIVDGSIDDPHPVHACIKDAIAKGLLVKDEEESSAPKAKKEKV